MGGLKEIFYGWANDFLDSFNLMDKKSKQISIDRLLICDKCNIRTGKICDKNKGGCGCPIYKKTKSMISNCIKNLW